MAVYRSAQGLGTRQVTGGDGEGQGVALAHRQSPDLSASARTFPALRRRRVVGPDVQRAAMTARRALVGHGDLDVKGDVDDRRAGRQDDVGDDEVRIGNRNGQSGAGAAGILIVAAINSREDVRPRQAKGSEEGRRAVFQVSDAQFDGAIQESYGAGWNRSAAHWRDGCGEGYRLVTARRIGGDCQDCCRLGLRYGDETPVDCPVIIGTNHLSLIVDAGRTSTGIATAPNAGSQRIWMFN